MSEQTTIAISRKNHETLCNIGRKGQSFDEVLTEVLNTVREYREQGKDFRKPKIQVDCSHPLVAGSHNIQIASECDSIP